MKNEKTGDLYNAVIEWADANGLNTDTPENFKEAREAYLKAINGEDEPVDEVFKVLDIQENEIPESLLQKLNGLQTWTDNHLTEHIWSNDDLKEKLHDIPLNLHEQATLRGIELRCDKNDCAYFRIIERK